VGRELERAVAAKFGAKSKQLAGMLLNIGNTHRLLKRYDAAEEYLKRGLDIWKHTGSEYEPTMLGELAQIYIDQNKYTEAEEYLTHALAIQDNRDPNSAEAATLRDAMAAVKNGQGKAAEAQELIRRAQANRARIAGLPADALEQADKLRARPDFS